MFTKQGFLLFIMIGVLLIFAVAMGCAKKITTSEIDVEKLHQETAKIGEEKDKTDALKSENIETVPISNTPIQVSPLSSEAVKLNEAAKQSTRMTLKMQDVFFDYDRFSIRDEAKPILETNAEYLKINKNSAIIIEGHCDERGTAEYNIALGERRAQSAEKYLIDFGINASRISILSYGKENPFCAGHNEQCWQENRRAHFVEK